MAHPQLLRPRGLWTRPARGGQGPAGGLTFRGRCREWGLVQTLSRRPSRLCPGLVSLCGAHGLGLSTQSWHGLQCCQGGCAVAGTDAEPLTHCVSLTHGQQPPPGGHSMVSLHQGLELQPVSAPQSLVRAPPACQGACLERSHFLASGKQAPSREPPTRTRLPGRDGVCQSVSLRGNFMWPDRRGDTELRPPRPAHLWHSRQGGLGGRPALPGHKRPACSHPRGSAGLPNVSIRKVGRAGAWRPGVNGACEHRREAALCGRPGGPGINGPSHAAGWPSASALS